MSLDNCKKRALRILGKKNFSESEMIKRLTGKGETAEDAAETVKWLVEMGYINDDNYASLIVNHYASKGYGEARIRDELSKRGIPRSIWHEHISVFNKDEQNASAAAFLRKKLRNGRLNEHDGSHGFDKDDIRRATDALVRRGFSYDEAKDAVNSYFNSIELK